MENLYTIEALQQASYLSPTDNQSAGLITRT
uniref:Uncharacterized protein n=1 Tax=Sphingobacterium sp. (strain 21) TaxID=743722 RepID=F4CD64_SPHS2